MTEPSSLEGRLAQLESTVRSLMATNWTDRASVVDASGAQVPLSAVAFGQVAQTWAGVGVVGLDATSGTSASGLSATVTATPTQGAWYQPNPGLQLDVLVTGTQLRVDWASLLALGTTTNVEAAYTCMSYSLDFLGDVTHHGAAPVSRVIGPDYYRSIQLRDNAGVGATGQMGSWFRHTGLTPGWYRVWAAWFLGYASSSANGSPHMNADNPRLAATPF